MNKIDITNISINLTICRHWPLKDMWRSHREQGWFWRFYVNDAPGAGIRVKGRKLELMPDYFYLIPPGVEFTTWQTGSPRQFYMHFDAPPPYTQVDKVYYKLPMTPVIKDYIEKITPELRPGGDFTTARGAMLCIALCALSLTHIPDDDLKDVCQNPIINKTIARMKEQMHHEFSINEQSSRHGLCPDSFIRLFKQHIGTTPYQYLTSLRIEKAAFMLETSYASIDDIAGLAGFKDRFHFSRVFKKRTGSSPAAYRQLRQR